MAECAAPPKRGAPGGRNAEMARARGGVRARAGGRLSTADKAACTATDCDAAQYAKGLCTRCWAAQRRAAQAAAPCTADGCAGRPYRRTLCHAHYRAFLRTKPEPVAPPCAVPHCDARSAKGTRFCCMHDSVYGDGVSKHTLQSLTPAAILRAALATREVLAEARAAAAP